MSITTNFAAGQDVLGFTNVPATMGNIAGAYNAATGVMTLTSAGATATHGPMAGGAAIGHLQQQQRQS